MIGNDQNHDLSNANAKNPTIGNNGGQLRVISNDTYDEVAASLWLKSGNCYMGENQGDTQGVLIKFENGQYVVARIQKEDSGFKLQWMGTINWLGDGFDGTSTAYGDGYWTNIVDSLDDDQMAAFNGDEGLKLTIVRSGNTLKTYVNDVEMPQGQVTLDGSYASMKVQVGFFDYSSTNNAEWKFEIK